MAIDPSFAAEMNKLSDIKHVVGVISGKGGVGKSLVTASLASMVRTEGYNVGILDADITGPSIPKMYGIHGPAEATPDGSYPIAAADGTRIMSINLLLEHEDTPVLWRGPVIAGAIKQFWTDVIWGDTDYLFVDMPPGTGDVAITVFQSLPLDGIVIVTSPQELVELIVTKAYKMAEMMNIPVLGIVENYSYLTCPDCGRRISIFGESRTEKTAGSLGVPLLAQLPMDPEFAALADSGSIHKIDTSLLREKALSILTSL